MTSLFFSSLCFVWRKNSRTFVIQAFPFVECFFHLFRSLQRTENYFVTTAWKHEAIRCTENNLSQTTKKLNKTNEGSAVSFPKGKGTSKFLFVNLAADSPSHRLLSPARKGVRTVAPVTVSTATFFHAAIHHLSLKIYDLFLKYFGLMTNNTWTFA